ncbi:MAG: hypothetical protein IPG45_05950 [Deltaproteobacteria bacterium]|nr:hypothetical protein [Deltaproteobacteria bacterium]
MALNASKAVEKALFDTWSRGVSLLGLVTDKGPLARGGDSYDLPFRSAAFTVNTSEVAAAAATTLTGNAVTVNRPKFVNQAMTMAQQAQLLGGDGAFAEEVAKAAGGDLINSLERDLIEYLIAEIAGGGGISAALHSNVAADAVASGDVNDLEAAVREQDGIAANAGLFWLCSPRALASIKSVNGYGAQVQSTPEQMKIGLPMGGMLNGMPIYLHNGVPGAVNRYSVTCASSNIATNVCTATFAVPHGIVAGQQIYTTGFTAGNVLVTAPATVTSTTATTVVFPQTAANGANGAGTIISASAMAMLCHGPWITFATDGAIPSVKMIGREGNAGDLLQLFHHFGRGALPGAAGVLHAPDGV